MRRIAAEDTPDGICLCPDITSVGIHGTVGQIKFGVPKVVAKWAMEGTHFIVCYAIKREDFERIKKELEHG